MAIEVSPVQPLKALYGIRVALLPILTVVIDVRPVKMPDVLQFLALK